MRSGQVGEDRGGPRLPPQAQRKLALMDRARPTRADQPRWQRGRNQPQTPPGPPHEAGVYDQRSQGGVTGSEGAWCTHAAMASGPMAPNHVPAPPRAGLCCRVDRARSPSSSRKHFLPRSQARATRPLAFVPRTGEAPIPPTCRAAPSIPMLLPTIPVPMEIAAPGWPGMCAPAPWACPSEHSGPADAKPGAPTGCETPPAPRSGGVPSEGTGKVGVGRTASTPTPASASAWMMFSQASGTPKVRTGRAGRPRPIRIVPPASMSLMRVFTGRPRRSRHTGRPPRLGGPAPSSASPHALCRSRHVPK